MKCYECQGACCETIHLDLNLRDEEIPWVMLHSVSATGTDRFDSFELNARCSELNKVTGACNIHEERPLICEFFVAGSKDCLDTVKKRRTPEEYQQIRDDSDPKEL